MPATKSGQDASFSIFGGWQLVLAPFPLFPQRTAGIDSIITLPVDISAPSRHRLSVADCRRMGEAGILSPDNRVELIDGETSQGFALFGVGAEW